MFNKKNNNIIFKKNTPNLVSGFIPPPSFKNKKNLVGGFTPIVDFGNAPTKVGARKNALPKFTTGFTLVETMFAVFILTFTIVGLMTVVSNSLFSARYARDEITANYLLQEVIDYIRNDRDTTVFLGSGSGSSLNTWNGFLSKYTKCTNTLRGCYFDVLKSTTPEECDTSNDPKETKCPYLYFDKEASNTSFYVSYGGVGTPGVKTNFQRKVMVTNPTADEIKVIITVYWKNGGLSKSRSLETSLLRWQN